MEQLKVAVCDDAQDERAKLLEMVQKSGFSVHTEEFSDGAAFLEAFREEPFDLVFMDIYGVSGVEMVRQVRELDAEVPIAFTTVSESHALDGYRLNVAKYIEKPVSQAAVDGMLALALEYRERKPGIPVVLGQRKPFWLPAERMLYAEQMGHYLLFHLSGGKVMQAKGRLDELEPQLQTGMFFRCHKSYLANLSFVTGIDREQMVFRMQDGSAVYIRREAFRRARDAWESWLFAAARKKGGQ